MRDWPAIDFRAAAGGPYQLYTSETPWGPSYQFQLGWDNYYRLKWEINLPPDLPPDDLPPDLPTEVQRMKAPPTVLAPLLARRFVLSFIDH